MCRTRVLPQLLIMVPGLLMAPCIHDCARAMDFVAKIDLRETQVYEAIDRLRVISRGEISLEQREAILRLAEEDRAPEVLPVSLQTSRAIYCLGLATNFVYAVMHARCIHIWTLRTYRVSMTGLGPGCQLQGTLFRLSFAYEAQNFDVVGAGNMDPILGQYGLATKGASLLLGLTAFDGMSNWPYIRSVRGSGINLGIGVDFGSITHVSVEPQ